jgi:hypothetical protein
VVAVGPPLDHKARRQRRAAICGLVAPAIYMLSLAIGGLAQSGGFSSLDDDISDLGAETASSPWVYNQIGANLTGILIVVFALGLWRALSPDVLGRVGSGALLLVGTAQFLEGFLRLDCRGIDAGCANTSWHADAHKMESRVAVVLFFVSPIVLALAFRHIDEWRDTWLPTLLAVPASIAASVVFSALGDGAATRAGTMVWLLWLGFVASRLLSRATAGNVQAGLAEGSAPLGA